MNREATLGSTVRDRRLALGYSLGQLATKVNKTAASIRSWERGDTVPTAEETAALSDALDLDADLLGSLRDTAAAGKAAAETAEPPEQPAEESQGAEAAPASAEPPGAEPAAESAAPQEDDATAEISEEPAPEAESAAEPGEDETIADDSASALATDAAAEAEGDEGEPEPSEPQVEEHPDIDSETHGGEALADAVAALATADFAADPVEASETAVVRPQPPEPSPPVPTGAGAAPALHEAMTEAVPVVPSGSVAVGSVAGSSDPTMVTQDAYTKLGSSNPVVQAWDNVVDTYHRIFDPRRKWIYRVRWVLLLIAFYIMLRVLGWAGGELWDAIGEVLDGIAFTPSETPDVSN